MKRKETVEFISALGRLWYVSKNEKTREYIKILQQHHLTELVNNEMDINKLRKDQNV